MRSGLLGIGLGTGLLLWPMAAAGQLTFEATLVEAQVDPAEETLEVSFPFGNGSGAAVSIVKIDTSCGCLRASADVSEVAPGGKGAVTGVFSVGVRTGTFQKTLTVKTLAKGKEATQELTVRVEVPPLLELTPQLLSWEVGAPLKKKSFVLRVLRDEPIEVIEANCSREGFECEISEIVKGKEYRLDLTPPSTGEPLMGIVRIETDCEIEKHRRKLAFFSVKRAPAGDGG